MHRAAFVGRKMLSLKLMVPLKLLCAIHSSWLKYVQLTANAQGGAEGAEKRVSLASEVTELEHALCLQQLFSFHFISMGVLSACVPTYHVCAWYPQRPEEGVGSPRPGVRGGCEPPRGCWELSLRPQQEQPGLLTMEPLLQSAF